MPPIMDEGYYLKQHGMALSESDDWPMFILTEAEVIDQEDNQPGDLLLAGQEGQLFTLRGILDGPDDGNLSRYKKTFIEPVPITVKDVKMRSYGQTEDGDIQIWGSGKSGWFEIQPRKGYQAVYDDMVKPLQLYFFMTVQLEQFPPKQLKNGPSLQAMVEAYSRKSRYKVEDIKKIFDDNEEFFHYELHKDNPDIQWKGSLIFKDLKRYFILANSKRKAEAASVNQLKRASSTSSVSSERSRRKKSVKVEVPTRPAAKTLPFHLSQNSVTYISSDESEAADEAPRSTRRPVQPRPLKTRTPPTKGQEFLESGSEQEHCGDDDHKDSEDQKPSLRVKAKRPNDNGLRSKLLGKPSKRRHTPPLSPDQRQDPEPRLRDATLEDLHNPKLKAYDVVRVPPNPSAQDVWLCPRCPHKVLKPKAASGRKEINDHEQKHADEVRERVDILDREGDKLQLSTTYLREAIMRAAQKDPHSQMPQRMIRSGY